MVTGNRPRFSGGVVRKTWLCQIDSVNCGLLLIDFWVDITRTSLPADQLSEEKGEDVLNNEQY